MGKLPICFSKRLFWAIKWHAVHRDNRNSESFCISSSMTHHTYNGTGHHGFGPWSQLPLQEQGLPLHPSRRANRTPAVFLVCTCHAMKLGCGRTCGWGNPILRAREPAARQSTWPCRAPRPVSSWARGMSSNTERMLWTEFECHGSEDPLMQLSGTFFSSLT